MTCVRRRLLDLAAFAARRANPTRTPKQTHASDSDGLSHFSRPKAALTI